MIVAVTVIAVGILTRSVGASHAGEVADCGPAGTFTIEAMVNGAGFESPPPDGVLRFEEGATLTLWQVSLNGTTLWHRAIVGSERNVLSEVTCTFLLPGGIRFEGTGLLSGR